MKKVLRSILIGTITLGLLISGVSCTTNGHTDSDGDGRADNGDTLVKLAPPSNLTAEELSPSSIELSWQDNSDNEDGFNIYRDSILIETVGVNVATYQDTGLEPATTYQYAVRAYNDAEESQAVVATVTTAGLSPLNIRLDYFGVKDNHGGYVQLVVVVSDGKTTESHLIPQDKYYRMDDYELMNIDQRQIFHTDSLAGDLTVNILAYNCNYLREQNLELLNMLEGLAGRPYPEIRNAIESTPQYDERIGEYNFQWNCNEPMPVGQYNERGVEDLRVWLTIWSDTSPDPWLPDVKIHNVELSPNAKVRGLLNSFILYNNTVKLDNNESFDIELDWQGHSSVSGNFDNGSVIVPKRSSVSIEKGYYYETAGSREITYTITYNGTVLDSWSGTLNVIP